MAVTWGLTADAFQTAGLDQYFDDTDSATIVDDHGQCGAQSILLAQGVNAGFVTKGVSAGDSRAIGHMAVYFEGAANLFYLYQGSTPVFRAQVNVDGSVTGYYNPDAAFPPVSFVSDGGLIPLNRLTAVVVDLLLGSAGNGEVSIWVNGQERWSMTGISTAWPGEETYTGIKLGGGVQGGPINTYYSSVLWLDGVEFDPALPLNTPLGHLGSAALLATGAGANTEWAVTGAAANWNVSDNNTPDPTTKYISSSTLNATDTYEYSDLPLIADTEIFYVQALILAKEDAAGTREVDAVVRQGGVDTLAGDPQAVPTTDYRYLVVPMPFNPATGAQWLLNDINSDQFGPEITT